MTPFKVDFIEAMIILLLLCWVLGVTVIRPGAPAVHLLLAIVVALLVLRLGSRGL